MSYYEEQRDNRLFSILDRIAKALEEKSGDLNGKSFLHSELNSKEFEEIASEIFEKIADSEATILAEIKQFAENKPVRNDLTNLIKNGEKELVSAKRIPYMNLKYWKCKYALIDILNELKKL